jgi:hypothetical protein
MTPTELSDAAGISVSYASMILSGDRTPPLGRALSIYDKTGLLFGPLTGKSEVEIAGLREALQTIGRLAA